MVGRAGRPGYDDEGKAVILCQNEYKAFLRRFLYGGFPLESSLLGILHDTVNAEVGGWRWLCASSSADRGVW